MRTRLVLFGLTLRDLLQPLIPVRFVLVRFMLARSLFELIELRFANGLRQRPVRLIEGAD